MERLLLQHCRSSSLQELLVFAHQAGAEASSSSQEGLQRWARQRRFWDAMCQAMEATHFRQVRALLLRLEKVFS